MAKRYKQVNYHLVGGRVVSNHDVKKKSVKRVRDNMADGCSGTLTLIPNDDSPTMIFNIRDIQLIECIEY